MEEEEQIHMKVVVAQKMAEGMFANEIDVLLFLISHSPKMMDR